MIPPPRKHQDEAIRFLEKRGGRGALFMEPGTGKTRIGIELAHEARTLVVAPLNPVEFVWPEETEKWAPYLSCVPIRGTPKEREAKLLSRHTNIAALNYELLPWLYDVARRHRGLPYDILYLDESTKIKSNGSVGFKVLKALEGVFDAVVPATGTPAPHSLADLWSQLYLVDRGRALGKNITQFREWFCTPVPQNNYTEWLVTDPEGVIERATPLCFVRRAKDCVDMPPLAWQERWFRLPPDVMRMYQRLRKQDMLVWERDAIVMKNRGVVSGKSQQVTSGFYYDELGEPHEVHREKVREYANLVEEMQGVPLLTCFLFTHERDMIRRELGYDVPSIDSSSDRRTTADVLRRWRRGEIPVLLGQLTAVELGLNMQCAGAHVAFYALPWSHQTFWQCIQRVWRQGQETGVIVHMLKGHATVDLRVAQVLKDREATESMLKQAVLDWENR